jgi:hypothetical protein
MAKKSQWVKISGWLFLLGVIIAVVGGVVAIPYASEILLVLGVIIGLMGAFGMGGIDRSDVQMFLLAVVALVSAGHAGAALQGIPSVGAYLKPMVDNIAALVLPAAVLLALEAIWRAGSVKF